MTLRKVYGNVMNHTKASYLKPLNLARFHKSGFILQNTKPTSDLDSAVLYDIVNDKGILTLNRPSKLNALNRDALDSILQKLLEWENKVEMVIIKGEGRAFCAGGDIISNSRKGYENAQKNKEFFSREYITNGLIGQYRVPYIALIDGITMGGGVGLSIHGRVRIATERTLFAMPETRIGLFTDVGVGHVLSRMPHHLGPFLALSGHRLKGTDVVKAGIATHYAKSENIPSILKGLIDLNEPANNLDEFLTRHTENLSNSEFSLKPYLDLIDKVFSAPSVEEIVQRLKDDGSEFATQTLDSLQKMSPTSLKISKKLVDLYKTKTLQEGLSIDNRLSKAAVDAKVTPDYYEGVRALLIDKDQNPKWNPATLEEVTEDMLEQAFSELSAEEELNFTSTLNKLRKELQS